MLLYSGTGRQAFLGPNLMMTVFGWYAMHHICHVQIGRIGGNLSPIFSLLLPMLLRFNQTLKQAHWRCSRYLSAVCLQTLAELRASGGPNRRFLIIATSQSFDSSVLVSEFFIEKFGFEFDKCQSSLGLNLDYVEDLSFDSKAWFWFQF